MALHWQAPKEKVMREITILADPQDCGIRESKHAWKSVTDAFRASPHEFPRVSRQREEALRWLAGDLFPQHPGEHCTLEVEEETHCFSLD